MLKIVLGTDWKINREFILNQISKDISEKRPGRVLMVPELISHQMERQLLELAGDSTCRYAEVLSFSRLSSRVADETGIQLLDCLDDGGRIVAMAAAVRQLHSKLKVYAAVETKPEFLSNLLDIVDEFKRCCITPGNIMEVAAKTEGTLAQKMEELSFIYEAYDAVCANSKRDPRDQMSWLLSQLEECDFAANHTFYFDAFPDFSKQHMDILQHLILHSPSVVISLNCDVPGSHALAFEKAGETAKELLGFVKRYDIAHEIISLQSKDLMRQPISSKLFQGMIESSFAADYVDVFHAETISSECAAVTEKIIQLVLEGCRYKDISIACTDLNKYSASLQRVFQRANIPFYLSGKECVLDKKIIQNILCAIDAALGGFSQKDVFQYIKSFLTPLTLDQSDRIENYCILWSIDGNRWTTQWENHPKGLVEQWTEYDRKKLEALNESRRRIIEPLVHLRKAFHASCNVRQQVLSIYAFFEEIQLKKKLEILATELDRNADFRNSQIVNQVWELLLGALEQLHDVLGDTVWDEETFTKLLKLLLSQYNVGTIPAVLDAVTVGSISTMRCNTTSHLFLLGAYEGAFPSFGADAGLLNDHERTIMMKLGLPINPGSIDGLQTQFSEIQEVFCGANQSITVSYSESQPSFITKRLVKMAGDDRKAEPRWGASLTNRLDAGAQLLQYKLSSKAEHLGLMEEIDTIQGCIQHDFGQVSSENICSLYHNKLNLSASQIDRLADCRLLYFLKYGICAKERKPATIDPAEFGTYVHAVLEACGRQTANLGGFKNVSLDEILNMARDASEKYYQDHFKQISSERIAYHFRKNTKELEIIVTELWNEMQETSFEAIDFELGFGEGMKMPPVPIQGGSIKAELRGFVDRVDIWEHDGRKHVRVVDYKTGKKEFDYCDVFNGLGLQMLLYLYALEDGGESLYGVKPEIAGVEYFPARVPFVSSDGILSEEEALALHAKDFRRRGLIVSDDDVLYAMENSDHPKRLPCKRKKDGSVSGDVASYGQFKNLKRHIFSILKQMVLDIESGNVTPNPYTRGSYHNACRFCPYGTICHSSEVPGRRNYQQMSSTRFWEEIAKEEDGNG